MAVSFLQLWSVVRKIFRHIIIIHELNKLVPSDDGRFQVLHVRDFYGTENGQARHDNHGHSKTKKRFCFRFYDTIFLFQLFWRLHYIPPFELPAPATWSIMAKARNAKSFMIRINITNVSFISSLSQVKRFLSENVFLIHNKFFFFLFVYSGQRARIAKSCCFQIDTN